MAKQNQDIILKAAGLYLSPNDFSATPEGGLNIADNVVLDQRNLLEPRRGFEGLGYVLPSTELRAYRLALFQGSTVAKVQGEVLRFVEESGWTTYSGTFNDPAAPYHRSRFLEANKNLYLTTDSGIKVLDKVDSEWASAGVPGGLDLQVATTGSSGWFTPNVRATTTAFATNGSPNLTDVADLSGIEVGQYAHGDGIPDLTLIDSITPSGIIIQQVGETVAGSDQLEVDSDAGIVEGTLISGEGIPNGTKVVSVSGGGPYTVTMSANAFVDSTTNLYIFASPPIVTLNKNVATATTDDLEFPDFASATSGDYFAIYDTDGNGWAAALDKTGSAPAPTGVVWTGINVARKVNVDISGLSNAYDVAEAVKNALNGLSGFTDKFTTFQGPDTAVAAEVTITNSTTPVSAVAASRTFTKDGGAYSLTLTANTPGIAGNNISFDLLASPSLTVADPVKVTGANIHFDLRCTSLGFGVAWLFGLGPYISNEINADPAAGILVTATEDGSFTTASFTVADIALANLAGGVDAIQGLDTNLTLVAVAPGAAGNNISIRLFDDGSATQTASVSVVGSAITVTLGKAAGLITTTNTDLVNLINAHPIASALVTASSSLTTEIVGPHPTTNLVDGADAAVGGELSITRTSIGTVDPTTFHDDDDSDPGSITGTQTGSGTIAVNFSSGSQVGYRVLYGIRDFNNNLKYGAPSQMAIAVNTTGETRNAIGESTLPDGITTNHFYQVFRSQATEGADIPPLDVMQLVYEQTITGTDLTNGYISFTDITPDSLKGLPLYTGQDREGILQANTAPPKANDFCNFRDMTIYSNVVTKQTRQFTILSVGAPDGVQPGDVLTIAGIQYTAATTENISTNRFQVFTDGTPAQNISDTANSLVKVINRATNNTTVYASLLVSEVDLPGQILLQERAVGGSPFLVNASAHATAYQPNLTPSGEDVMSSNDVLPNQIFVSKLGQPEAVPIVNTYPVGNASAAILRVIPLREYVLVFKEDGVFRVTGFDPLGLIVTPTDLSTRIIGADTAVALANEVWMFSNQGVVSVSDTGVEIRSRAIETFFQQLTGTAIDTIRKIAYAIPYETDKKYILALPDSSGDVTCSQMLTYNYLTTTWTRWLRDTAGGYINPAEDRLYIGNGLDNSVSAERKSFTYRDFVDESFPITVIGYDEYEVQVDSIQNVKVGDVLSQVDGSVLRSSVVVEIDPLLDVLVTENKVQWNLDEPFEILQAFTCTMQWKPVVAGNPMYMKQFSEGLAAFRVTRFPLATIDFFTDVSPSYEGQPLSGSAIGSWGQFPWGTVPWGGVLKPKTLRFYVPGNKQYASQINTRLTLRAGYSNWQLQGLSLSWSDISDEVA